MDVENVRAREVDIEIADRYFAPAEVAALRALPSEQQQQRFFDYWTLKESYIKARGMGLSIPLERFAFDLEDSAGIRLKIDSSLDDRSDRWRFGQLSLLQDHMIAVCVEREARGRERVRDFVCEPVDEFTRSTRIDLRTGWPVAPWQHAMRSAGSSSSR